MSALAEVGRPETLRAPAGRGPLRAASNEEGPLAGPLSSVVRGWGSLDDADGRGDRQAQRQDERGGDLVEQTFETDETSERHDTHTFELGPRGAGTYVI